MIGTHPSPTQTLSELRIGKANRHLVSQRIIQLDSICASLVEFGVTLLELEQYFINEYETTDAAIIRKRKTQAGKQRRSEIGKNAVNTRWARYEKLKTSHIVKKETAIKRAAAVPIPEGFKMVSIATPEPLTPTQPTTPTVPVTQPRKPDPEPESEPEPEDKPSKRTKGHK
jgi:hypothetical protein